jgi:hypothetical protein
LLAGEAKGEGELVDHRLAGQRQRPAAQQAHGLADGVRAAAGVREPQKLGVFKGHANLPEPRTDLYLILIKLFFYQLKKLCGNNFGNNFSIKNLNYFQSDGIN